MMKTQQYIDFITYRRILVSDFNITQNTVNITPDRLIDWCITNQEFVVPNDETIKMVCRPTYNPFIVKRDRFLFDCVDVKEQGYYLLNGWIMNDIGQTFHFLHASFCYDMAERYNISKEKFFWYSGKWNNTLDKVFEDLLNDIKKVLDDKQHIKQINDEIEKKQLDYNIEKFGELFL